VSTPPPPSTRARFYKADPNGNESGKSYVIFGKTDTNAIDLAKLGGNSKW
jgi:hypothetical protein